MQANSKFVLYILSILSYFYFFIVSPSEYIIPPKECKQMFCLGLLLFCDYILFDHYCVNILLFITGHIVRDHHENVKG